MIKAFQANDLEVTEFRNIILAENKDNQYTKWFCDDKFLRNGFDKVLLYYHDDQPIGIAGGTHWTDKLYRNTQMYYILKEARKQRGLDTLHYRPNGFFDVQLERAKELGCYGTFLSIHCFDDRHVRLFEYMKNDVVGPGMMPNSERKYTAKDFQFLDKEYIIKGVPQRIIFHPIVEGAEFEDLFNRERAF